MAPTGTLEGPGAQVAGGWACAWCQGTTGDAEPGMEVAAGCHRALRDKVVQHWSTEQVKGPQGPQVPAVPWPRSQGTSSTDNRVPPVGSFRGFSHTLNPMGAPHCARHRVWTQISQRRERHQPWDRHRPCSPLPAHPSTAAGMGRGQSPSLSWEAQELWQQMVLAGAKPGWMGWGRPRAAPLGQGELRNSPRPLLLLRQRGPRGKHAPGAAPSGMLAEELHPLPAAAPHCPSPPCAQASSNFRPWECIPLREPGIPG